MIFSIFSFVQAVILSTASGISWSPESGLCIQIHGILAALAAFPPFVESSITIHSSTGTPSCFAAKRNVSGAGFGFFTSSPLVTTSKYFIRSSVSNVSVITGFGEEDATDRRYPASFRQQSICSTPGILGNPSLAIISSFFSFMI